MAGPALSADDIEALRLMQEEHGHYDGDLRSEGDPDWYANGAQIELFGLQSEKAKFMNGLTAEVIGFDNEHRRYRVRLHEEGTVKVVAKKNMRLLPDDYFADPTEALPSDNGVRLGPQQHNLTPRADRQLQALAPTANVEIVPTVGVVRRSIDKVSRDTSTLRSLCQLRQSGVQGGNMCDAYLQLAVAMDTCTEVMDMYYTAYGVRDEDDSQTIVRGANQDLRRLGDAAIRGAEAAIEVYQPLRTWAELATDEMNITRYSIRKHGVMGTLKNEFVEVGRDVAEIGGGAAEIARTGAGHVPRVVRQATGTLGDAVQQGSQAAATATSGILVRSQQQARQALEDQLITPVKRTWHLAVTGFLVCYLVPLFGLRTYAPLNSVVGNLGLVYAGVCIVCPPRCARSRAAKGAMLILWPICMVVLPLALHYWLTHPPVPSPEPPERQSSPWYQPQVSLLDRIPLPAQSGKAASEAPAPAEQDRRGWHPSSWMKGAEKVEKDAAWVAFPSWGAKRPAISGSLAGSRLRGGSAAEGQRMPGASASDHAISQRAPRASAAWEMPWALLGQRRRVLRRAAADYGRAEV